MLQRLLAAPAVQRRLFGVARRFVAGESAAEAIAAIARLNAEGIAATVDFLGEDVTDGAEAERTRDAYLEILAAIRERRADANVSVKLTAIGLLLGEDVAAANLRAIVQAAAPNADPFVRVDMEGSAVTEITLRIVDRLFAETGRVGPVLQAMLRRTPGDVERAIAAGERVRLCKGAYKESPAVALTGADAIRAAYLRCAEALLARGVYPAFATHDERLIEALVRHAAERGVSADRFEFQQLYGVRPDLQRRLVASGHRVRVYVPYGTHWAGYFARRIGERRENAGLALRSLLGR